MFNRFYNRYILNSAQAPLGQVKTTSILAGMLSLQMKSLGRVYLLKQLILNFTPPPPPSSFFL